MLRERREIVTGIHDHLRPAEASLDGALRDVAALNAHLPTARVAAHMAMEVGQSAVEAFGEAQSLIIRARAKMIEGHRALAAAQKSHAFPIVADGGGGNKDPNQPPFVIIRSERDAA